MAQTPAEQLAAILTDALNQFAKDNPDLFTVNVQGGGGGGSGDGGGTGDIVGAILGLIGISLLTNPEFLPLAEGLKSVQDEGGGQGLAFLSGWFVAETMLQFAEPVTRQLTHMIEEINTSQILDPATAADFVSKRIISQQFGQSEAAGGGFDTPHFNWMLEASYTWPGAAQIFALWNRGYIGDDDAHLMLQRAGVPDAYISQIAEMKRELLTPADWALAALRKNVDVDTATAGAAMWGLTADDFNTLLLNTGEPPGTMQLLEAYRRGFIDEPTLEQGILQSRVRDEWIPTLEKLRYAPMSTAAAANAVVRGYLTDADGADIAQQNGLEPDHWQYVLESNGRPPSHEQLATLYLRGIITEDQFKQGVRESDIKDKYIDDVFDLRVKFLPLFEARTLLNDGDITGKTFSEQMLVQGYQKEVIDEILAAVGTGKKTTAKHLTAADYTDMYTDGLKSRTDTIAGLKTIGYDDTDAEALVTIAEAKQVAKLTNALVTNVRSQFNRFKLTVDQAKDRLVTIGVESGEADKLVTEWDIVRPEGTRTLTEAQILKAAKDGAITKDDAYTRLRGLGLDETDANLLIEIDG